MNTPTLLQTPKLTRSASLKTLIENGTIFNLQHCELNLFETYQQAEKVALTFNDVGNFEQYITACSNGCF